MKTYKFEARIEPGNGGGAFVFFPHDVQQEFGTRGRVPVKATFDGIPYTGSLIKYGHPLHMLGIFKSIRAQLGKEIGDTVQVEVWKDESHRTVEVPEHFQTLMDQQGLQPFFDSLSYTHRKEYVRYVTEAKTEVTRQKRLTRSLEFLQQGVKTPDQPNLR